MSDKAKIISIKFLIERYKKEIEDLKHNKMFDEEVRVQVAKGLELYVFDLELIMDAK